MSGSGEDLTRRLQCLPIGKRRFSALICILLAASLVIIIVVLNTEHYLPQMKSLITVNDVVDDSTTNVSISQFYDENLTAPRVICMILTRPQNWATRGRAVRSTWAKRCYKAIFFYTRLDDCSSQPICKDPNAVGLIVPDGRGHLTAKTLGALNYSYSKYGGQGNYFYKADDDTYVIMENLQRIISKYNASHFLYLGRTINNILPKGYASGGAGYIISDKAAGLLVRNASSFPTECRRDGGYEDVEIGKCLSKFGVYPEKEVDTSGRLVFHSDNPFLVFQGAPVSQAYYINFNGAGFGNKKTINEGGFMLSDWTATMHYVTPPEMYMYDFLLYQLKREDRI